MSNIQPADFVHIKHELGDYIARVTLDRPDARNALNARAYGELEAAFRHIPREPDARCVVLTGTDRAFCSGEDVKQMRTGPAREQSQARLSAVRPLITPAAQAVLACDRPIIAAVNGVAVGWGMELALFADIRSASRNAKFGEIFIKRGLVTDVGGMMILPRLVEPQKAAELLFTGEITGVDEAEKIGLVSRAVAHERLLPEAPDLARRIAVKAPLALRFLKEGLRRVASFLEKGTLVFNGR